MPFPPFPTNAELEGHDFSDVDGSGSDFTDWMGAVGVVLNDGGLVGPQGDPGPQGEEGPTGPTGATGPTGTGLTFKGAWSAVTAYVPGDWVTDGGVAYVAITSHTNSDPPSADWVAIPAGPAGPTGATGATGSAGATGAQGAAGAAGSILNTLIPFSSLTGATDSLKLAAFCTAYSGATFKPTLVLDELRDYTFTTQQQIYTGFSMIGGAFRALDQARSSTPYAQKVRLRLTSGTGWLTVPNGTVFGIFIQGLTVDATGVTNFNRMFAPNASCVIWTTTLRDISYQNGPGIMGAPGTPQPVDNLCVDGYWNVNNIQNATTGDAFHVSGADSFITPTCMLINSPNTLMDPTGILMRFTNFSKSHVRNLYLTAWEHHAMQWSGSNKMARLSDSTIEGHNAGEPCLGRLIGIDDSDLTIVNTWTSFAMGTPASGEGGEPSNRGIVQIEGAANVTIIGGSYECATSVANTVPYVYVASGATGTLRITNMFAIKGSTPFIPKVLVPSAFAGNVISDATVDVDTY